MAHRSFATQVDPSKAPTTFDITGTILDGRGQATGETFTETFTALPKIPGVALDALAKSIRMDRKGKQAYDAPSVVNFLTAVVVPDDLPRFVATIEDPLRQISLELLADIMDWLAEELADERPTKR